jgi:hypothetical protein
MKIHFKITDADGTVLATGSGPTHHVAVNSWVNHSEVKRMASLADMTDRPGQVLSMWVETE